jgi:hypothetical protein
MAGQTNADPLNLTGIILPGLRVSRLAAIGSGRRIQRGRRKFHRRQQPHEDRPRSHFSPVLSR